MGTLEGGGRVLKFLVVFFNALFVILGMALIAVGTWAEIEYGDFVDITSIEYATGTRLVISAGVIITIVSLFGCLGAFKENRCMLITFFVFLLIILALEIAAAVLAYQRRDQLNDQFKKDFLRAVQHDYGKDTQRGSSIAVNKLQEKLNCCGVRNYMDWSQSTYTNGSNLRVPDSCCKVIATKCGDSRVTGHKADNIYKEGCYSKLVDLVRDKLYIIGAFAITILVVQILGMIFSLVLVLKIGKAGEYA